jgi:hypothetical protein
MERIPSIQQGHRQEIQDLNLLAEMLYDSVDDSDAVSEDGIMNR